VLIALPLLPLAPTLVSSGDVAPNADDAFVRAYGFAARHVLRGHAVSRNFHELAAGDSLLELTLKSRGPAFRNAAAKLELMRATLDAVLELMDDEPYARLEKLVRAIGQTFAASEAANRPSMRFGRSSEGPVLDRCLAATNCLADCLRPLVDSMPVPFRPESDGQPAAMLIRARLDFVHQFWESRSPASNDPVLQVVVCPACGQRTRHMTCERCAYPLHEVKAAWVAAYVGFEACELPGGAEADDDGGL